MKLSVSVQLLAASATLTCVIACGSGTAQKATTSQKINSTLAATPSTASVNPVGSPSPASRYLTDADYSQHVTELRARIQTKLGNNTFSIIIQRPFVVVGDESEEAVKNQAIGNVKWAVDLLKQDYFTKDPAEILEIWLFKDDASYRKNAKLLFDDDPTTPYGYYSPAHKALIMNISTGGGTLVHEIVHPLMEANFPSCPPWFNEGMGSLYEACGDVGGHIHGYTNWRLPGLQQSVRKKHLASFESLTAMDARTFYNDDRGNNYAQARYLCYYLQEKGLLQKFYQEFVANQTEDPTGFKTLKKILGETDMESFQERWEKYVLTLRVGYSVEVE